jgi:predicted Zn-ribbon and HTH transcriptional regulator
MIGAVTTITCKRCGLSFETAATTNTRCRRCRTVVRVPAAARTKEHTFGIVLLSCGHPDAVIIHPGRLLAHILKQAEWECPDTGADVTAERVLAVLTEEQWEALTEEAIDQLVASG